MNKTTKKVFSEIIKMAGSIALIILWSAELTRILG